jgi:hypothetical protein
MLQQGKHTEDFGRQAAAGRPGLIVEFWDFLKQTKKWWLLPILIVFAVMGILILLGGTAAAPFIYTLF